MIYLLIVFIIWVFFQFRTHNKNSKVFAKAILDLQNAVTQLQATAMENDREAPNE